MNNLCQGLRGLVFCDKGGPAVDHIRRRLSLLLSPLSFVTDNGTM